ncbi:MAG: hypothetical protein ACK4Y6_00230 [Bacteroidota bacterium]
MNEYTFSLFNPLGLELQSCILNAAEHSILITYLPQRVYSIRLYKYDCSTLIKVIKHWFSFIQLSTI